jgi:hypothetical protein
MGFLTPRMLRLLAVSYLVKTAVVGLLWLAIPDLPQRAGTTARAAWASLVGASEAR